MPYAQKRCPHGWYPGITDLASSAVFNTSTECPKCRAERRERYKRRQAARTPAQRQKDAKNLAIGFVVMAVVVLGLILVVHAVLSSYNPTP